MHQKLSLYHLARMKKWRQAHMFFDHQKIKKTLQKLSKSLQIPDQTVTSDRLPSPNSSSFLKDSSCDHRRKSGEHRKKLTANLHSRRSLCTNMQFFVEVFATTNSIQCWMSGGRLNSNFNPIRPLFSMDLTEWTAGVRFEDVMNSNCKNMASTIVIYVMLLCRSIFCNMMIYQWVIGWDVEILAQLFGWSVNWEIKNCWDRTEQ